MIERGAVVIALFWLAACGQTGALYLPDEGTSTPVQIRPIGASGATPGTTPAPATGEPGAAAGTPAAATPADDAKKKAAAPQAPTAPPATAPAP